MDYEKQYKDLITRLIALVDVQSPFTKDALYSLFPEIKKAESVEDIAEMYVADEKCKPWTELCKKAFIAGANWQKHQPIRTIYWPNVQEEIDRYERMIKLHLNGD